MPDNKDNKDNTSIKDAVSAAAATLEKEDSSDNSEDIDVELLPEDPETESKEDAEDKSDEDDSEDTKEDEDSEEEKEETELSEAEKVWRALNADPIGTLQFFAKQVGAEVVTGSKGTNEEPTEKEKTKIVDIMIKHMGKDYGFMAPQLASAIEEILATRVDTKFQQKETEAETIFVENEIKSLLNKDGVVSADKATVANKMSKLFKQMPPNYSNTKELKEYIENVYTLASLDVKKTKKAKDEVKDRVKRINQNLQDDEPSSVSSGEMKIRKRPEKLTIKDAVRAAAQGVQYSE